MLVTDVERREVALKLVLKLVRIGLGKSLMIVHTFQTLNLSCKF